MSSNPVDASAANLTDLRCEYLADPLGIDVAKPRLSWVIESAQRGETADGVSGPGRLDAGAARQRPG